MTADLIAGSEIEHFSEFCSRHLIQSVDDWAGKPLLLEPFQVRMMGDALAYDEHGWPVWRSVVLCLPRKNGKTALLAAYALYRLLTSEGSPEILLAASSDKQAGRLFDAAAAFVRKSRDLSDLVRVRDFAGELVREDGGGQILRLSSDPARLHGYSPSLVVCDELAQWTTPTLRRAYAALTSGGGARRAPQVFTITTAGEAHTRHDSILGRILDAALVADETEAEPGLLVARMWDARMLVYNYEAPTANPRDVASMKLANPASWISEEYLSRQAADPELSDADVLQLHGCVWAASARTWVDPMVFAGLRDRRPLPEGVRCALAFDGSYSRDSTVLVGCTVEEHPYLWVERVWEKPAGGGERWRVPRNEVFAAVERAMGRLDVLEFCPDPPGWHREVEEWEDLYGEVVVRFETKQPSRMGPACDDFTQAVADGELAHDGSEPLLRHLGHCVPVLRSGYTVVTKDHPDSAKKIDVAVGAIVAYHRARWLWTNWEEAAVAFVVDLQPHGAAR